MLTRQRTVGFVDVRSPVSIHLAKQCIRDLDQAVDESDRTLVVVESPGSKVRYRLPRRDCVACLSDCFFSIHAGSVS